MSSSSKGSGTNIDINLDQDFDIDYENKRESYDRETENTTTYNHNYNTSHTTEVEWIKTTGYKLGLELETEHTTTENYNKNVDVEVDHSYTSDTLIIDVQKTVDENITFDQTEIWDVEVNVTAESIIQDSHVDFDEDINDIDLSKLINVGPEGDVTMEDFSVDVRSIGDSFNGAGNDGHANVNQANNLVDNDTVSGTGTSYANQQAPNVSGTLEASAYLAANHESGSTYNSGHGGDFNSYTSYYPYYNHTNGSAYGYGNASSWYAAAAAASGTLAIDVSLTAPTDAFETVTAEGGNSNAGDGIANANLTNTNTENEGDGIVSGDTSASADASATAASFNNDITAGGNQQANFATVNLVGGDRLDAGDGFAGGVGTYTAPDENGNGDSEGEGDGGLAIRDSYVTFENDLNDIDASELINVAGTLDMEDFDLDVDAIASSFNGPGNDWAFDVNQTNDLVDNDAVTGTYATYVGSGWNAPFQSVSAAGGYAGAGDGVGTIVGNGVANSNGGDGAILGSSAASADAIASASAFSNSIVVGANLQVNNFTATVVGGDSSILDDLAS